MSGRIRTIKPELLEDERTASLSHEGFRLFVSLILLADDHGNLAAHPARLHGSVFWARETLASVSELLRELVEAGLVRLYTVRGQTFAHLTGWAKHQKVDKPSKPRVPRPEEADSSGNGAPSPVARESLARPSRGSRETLAPDPDLRSPIPTPTADDARPAAGALAAPPPAGAGAGNGGGTMAVAHSAHPDPLVGALAAELRKHPTLAPVADLETAAKILGLFPAKVLPDAKLPATARVAWLAAAIAKAAFEVPAGATADAALRKVRVFCANASASDVRPAERAPRAAAPSGQAAQPVVPDGVGWKRDEAARRAAQQAELTELGKDAPL